MMNTTAMPIKLRTAVIGGFVNAIINATTQWYKVKDETMLLLTDDRISSRMDTVFSGAVPQALFLAFIQTAIVYFTTKIPGKPPYFPKIFFASMKHAVFAFGAVTIIAIMIQRSIGSIHITPFQSTLTIGVIAGLVAGTVNYQTNKAILNDCTENREHPLVK